VDQKPRPSQDMTLAKLSTEEGLDPERPDMSRIEC